MTTHRNAASMFLLAPQDPGPAARNPGPTRPRQQAGPRNPSLRLGFSAGLLSVLLAAFGLAGCKDTPSAADVEWQLEHLIPGLRLERESHIRIPRIAMVVARKLMRMLPDEDKEDLKLISHVKRVNVATYRVVSRPTAATLEAPARFEKRLTRDDWELVVRQREDDEHTWLFYRHAEEGAITNLYVVALDAHELTVVDLAGRLDRIFAEVFADDPGELVEIFGP